MVKCKRNRIHYGLRHEAQTFTNELPQHSLNCWLIEAIRGTYQANYTRQNRGEWNASSCQESNTTVDLHNECDGIASFQGAWKNRRERLVHTVCACVAPKDFLGKLETSVNSLRFFECLGTRLVMAQTRRLPGKCCECSIVCLFVCLFVCFLLWFRWEDPVNEEIPNSTKG